MESNDVSLNHIRDICQLKELRPLGLIHAFMGEQIPFGIDSNAISKFTYGNIKSDYPTRKFENAGKMKQIIEFLCDEADSSGFVKETKDKIRKLLEDDQRVMDNHNALFSLNLCTNPNPTPEMKKQFNRLKHSIDVLNAHNTLDSITYAMFLLVMVAVLQDRIIEVSKIYDLSYIKETNPAFKDLLIFRENGAGYLEDGMNLFPNIKSIDLAFHSGADWLGDDDDKYEILEKIGAQDLNLRVLVNNEEAIGLLCKYMRHPSKKDKYRGFGQYIMSWKEFEKKYPGTIEVRVSKLPLMHRMYLVRSQEEGKGIANVTFYTYGTELRKKSARVCFGIDSPEYKVFAQEFDFLWEQAKNN